MVVLLAGLISHNSIHLLVITTDFCDESNAPKKLWTNICQPQLLTASLSDLGKDNLDQNAEESACTKDQSFTNHSIAEAMAHWENRSLCI